MEHRTSFWLRGFLCALVLLAVLACSGPPPIEVLAAEPPTLSIAKTSATLFTVTVRCTVTNNFDYGTRGIQYRRKGYLAWTEISYADPYDNPYSVKIPDLTNGTVYEVRGFLYHGFYEGMTKIYSSSIFVSCAELPVLDITSIDRISQTSATVHVSVDPNGQKLKAVSLQLYRASDSILVWNSQLYSNITTRQSKDVKITGMIADTKYKVRLNCVNANNEPYYAEFTLFKTMAVPTPTPAPTASPTPAPTDAPTSAPTASATTAVSPTADPTAAPTQDPQTTPTTEPTEPAQETPAPTQPIATPTGQGNGDENPKTTLPLGITLLIVGLTLAVLGLAAGLFLKSRRTRKAKE